MPVISRFFGMVIKMYYVPSEHNPPHIHVLYGEFVGVIDIKTTEMLQGDLPEKELYIVRKWMKKHKNELIKMWDTQKIHSLPPLE